MLRVSPEDGASASVPRVHPSLSEPHSAFKRNLQLLAGNPCRHSCSTNPSLAHSIPPSNWQSLRCNHRERQGRRQERNRRPALGSPFHAPYSTTLSCLQTIPPPNWRSRRHNCMGRQVQLALVEVVPASALLAGGLAEGIQHGGPCSTTPSCLLSNCPVCPPHNCRGRLDRQAEAAVSGVAAFVAVLVGAWAVGLAAESAAEWASEWLVPGWGNRLRLYCSNTAAVLATKLLLLQGYMRQLSNQRARTRRLPTRARATMAATTTSSASSTL